MIFCFVWRKGGYTDFTNLTNCIQNITCQRVMPYFPCGIAENRLEIDSLVSSAMISFVRLVRFLLSCQNIHCKMAK